MMQNFHPHLFQTAEQRGVCLAAAVVHANDRFEDLARHQGGRDVDQNRRGFVGGDERDGTGRSHGRMVRGGDGTGGESMPGDPAVKNVGCRAAAGGPAAGTGQRFQLCNTS